MTVLPVRLLLGSALLEHNVTDIGMFIAKKRPIEDLLANTQRRVASFDFWAKLTPSERKTTLRAARKLIRAGLKLRWHHALFGKRITHCELRASIVLALGWNKLKDKLAEEEPEEQLASK